MMMKIFKESITKIYTWIYYIKNDLIELEQEFHEYDYSQTCLKDHIYRETTCKEGHIWHPPIVAFLLRFYFIRKPPVKKVSFGFLRGWSLYRGWPVLY